MIALVVSTLFSAAFATIMRFSQGKRCDLVAVGAVNYLVASSFQWILAAFGGVAGPLRAETALIGVVAGVLYASSYFVLFPLMKMRGVSISVAVQKLSVVIPVGFSMLFWGESMNGLQAVGSTLALASFPLLGIVPPPSAGTAPADKRQNRLMVLLLAGLFVANGLVLLAPRAYKQTGIRGQESAYLGILFGVAALILGITWMVRGPRAASPAGTAGIPMTVACGVALGLSNGICNRGTVFALQALPSVVVYPFYSAAGLAVTVLVSRLLWKERFRPMEAAGLLAACAAALLVNAG